MSVFVARAIHLPGIAEIHYVRSVPEADVGTGSPVVAAMDGFTGAASPVAPGTAVLHRVVRAICQVKQV